MYSATAPMSLAPYSAHATSDTTSLTQQRASYLARLAICILHTRRPILQYIFDTPCPIFSLHLDSESPRPDSLTTRICHSLAATLKYVPSDTSPDTIPYALCLLLKFRAAPHAIRDALVSRDASDELLIISAVYLAYKFLNDCNMEGVRHWAAPCGLSGRCVVKAEMQFLAVLGHGIWVRDGEYVALKGRLDELWAEVYNRAQRPTIPAFMVSNLGRLG